MSEDLKISSEYLNELIIECGRRSVGKLLNKLEIFESDERLKQLCKNTLYESFREFRDLLIAHNKGINISVIKFQSKDHPTHEE